MSSRTFTRSKPSNVYHLPDTPDSECLCEKCQNIKLIKLQLLKNKFQGIHNSMLENVKETICIVAETDVHVDPTIEYFQCLTYECKTCEVEIYKQKILDLNKELETDPTEVKWKRWELVKKDYGPHAKMDIVFKKTSKLQLVEQYLKDLSTLAFHKYWGYGQFHHVQTNLKPVYLRFI